MKNSSGLEKWLSQGSARCESNRTHMKVDAMSVGSSSRDRGMTGGRSGARELSD